MKRIIILVIAIMGYSTINAQQIRDLKYFYTDSNKYYPSEFFALKYYKDINNLFALFIGQWKSTTGNQTLVVTLWKETKRPTESDNGEVILFYCDEIYGHYQIFQDYGLSTQTQLYTSQINIGNTTQLWDSVIFAKSTTPNELSGVILDVNGTPLNPTKYPQGVNGLFSMIINSGTSPVTAQWRISNPGSIGRADKPVNFVIPTNVVLTKM